MDISRLQITPQEMINDCNVFSHETNGTVAVSTSSPCEGVCKGLRGHHPTGASRFQSSPTWWTNPPTDPPRPPAGAAAAGGQTCRRPTDQSPQSVCGQTMIH